MIPESVGGMNVNKPAWKGSDNQIQVFLSLVGKCTRCSSLSSFIISLKMSPSDGLNGEPDFMSLTGQTMLLKFLSDWTDSPPRSSLTHTDKLKFIHLLKLKKRKLNMLRFEHNIKQSAVQKVSVRKPSDWQRGPPRSFLTHTVR